jgi:hypothetical protein
MTDASSNGNVSRERLPEVWQPKILPLIASKDAATAELLRDTKLVIATTGEVLVVFSDADAVLQKQAEEPGNIALLEETLAEATGAGVAATIARQSDLWIWKVWDVPTDEPDVGEAQAEAAPNDPLETEPDIIALEPEDDSDRVRDPGAVDAWAFPGDDVDVTQPAPEPEPDNDEDDAWEPAALTREHPVDSTEFEPEDEVDSDADPDRDDRSQRTPGRDVDGRWRLPDLEPAALYGLVGEYALAVQPYTEACVAGVLISSLIGFGNAVNRNPYIDVGGTRHHVNENALLVGPTGTARKGEAMNIGLRPIRNASAEWGNECIKRGFGSGEAIVDSVRDRVAVVEGDDERVLDEGAKDKRLLVYEDEFSHVITVAGREGSTLSSHIRNAWDSRRLEARTKGKALVATGAHVSILAGITPEELVRRLPETELANGFLNRFVLAAVDRSRVLPEPPPIPPSFDAEWADRFGALLAWTRRDGTGHIERDNEASELWDQSYRERLSIERHGLAGAVCSRAEAHVLRLSMIYALLDRSLVIRRDHLEAALAVWGYCEASVLLVFGDRIGDAVADKILKELRDQGELTREQIVNLFSRHKNRAEIENALQLLERSGQIIMGTRGTGGRPKTVVRLRR